MSLPADKELTPSPPLLQEKDLGGIAASFLRRTQMLSINIGSSLKIVSCSSSDGKSVWMKPWFGYHFAGLEHNSSGKRFSSNYWL